MTRMKFDSRGKLRKGPWGWKFGLRIARESIFYAILLTAIVYLVVEVMAEAEIGSAIVEWAMKGL